MNTRKILVGLLIGLSLAATYTAPLVAQTFHSVGVRVAFSWGEVPIMLGAEVSMELGDSLASVSLFLSPGGRTLLLASYDLPILSEGQAFIRATTGFFYYGRNQMLPTPVIGTGLAFRPVLMDPIGATFAGAFIYPIAFPMPLMSMSLGWLF